MVRTLLKLGIDGCPVKEDSKDVPHIDIEIYRSPYEYSEEKATVVQWKHVGQMVRKMNQPVCKEAISQAFFTPEKHTDQTSVVFLLYGVPKKGRRNIYGFALCDDLKDGRHASEIENSLYVDAVCANPGLIREDRRIVTNQSIGKILINAIESYAKAKGFEMVKLSAIPYVLQYYRKLGYRHINAGETAINENEAITRYATDAGKIRYKDDEELLTAYKIELALAMEMTGSQEEKREYEASTLRKYFPDFYFIAEGGDRILVEPRYYDTEDLDISIKEDREAIDELDKIQLILDSRLLTKRRSQNSGISIGTMLATRSYLNTLVKKGFSVDCPEGPASRNVLKFGSNSLGKFADAKCNDSGFTMRKSLVSYIPLIECGQRGGTRRGHYKMHKRTMKN